LTGSFIENISKSTNNYCIYLRHNNPENCVKFNLLTENIKKEYNEINLYFVTSKEIIDQLKLPDNFIDINFFSENKNKFGCIEDFQTNPKTDPIEDFCKKNKIELCVDNNYPEPKGNKIIVYTQSFDCHKSLNDKDLEKLRNMFGCNLIINPKNFDDAKCVIGPECYQIFQSAFKKISTYIISNNGNYVDLFLKMFPRHKKLEL